jgi:penicillin-binding protein 2
MKRWHRTRAVKNEVAGKTHAQFWREQRQADKDNHTWFISFAPYEKPKFAICVFVQGANRRRRLSADRAEDSRGKPRPERGTIPGSPSWSPPSAASRRSRRSITSARTCLRDGAGSRDCRPHGRAAVPKKKAKQCESRPDIRPDADQGGGSLRHARSQFSGQLKNGTSSSDSLGVETATTTNVPLAHHPGRRALIAQCSPNFTPRSFP